MLGAMKMSVSVPKDLSRQVERVAQQLGVSPSEVVRRAMREFVETLAPSSVLDGTGAPANGDNAG
jgi:metal-responsive CopG/Arc/MetJ family transcriptional regulator